MRDRPSLLHEVAALALAVLVLVLKHRDGQVDGYWHGDGLLPRLGCYVHE